ncbi:MAG TPA: butyrate kinase, partial [bacterium]|nr:butyrate kinase [bacterium]
DEKLLRDIEENRVQADHISNIGAVLAFRLAEPAGIPSFFVDPVSVDEFDEVARISGIPEIPRVSLVHALNVKATARKAAAQLGRPLSEINLIVAHLGGGISICPLLKGRIIDVNNANEGGPFSPERAGSLPCSSLVKLCFSGQFTYEELKKRLVGNGGLTAYMGTHDTREVEARIQSGDEEARLIYAAMAYQIAKEIGAASTVLKGDVDGICLTGGVARSEMMVEWIRERVGFLAEVMVFPGENELESLALGALRVLRKEEESLVY